MKAETRKMTVFMEVARQRLGEEMESAIFKEMTLELNGDTR